MNDSLNRQELEKLQSKRLRQLFRAVLPANQFYRDKFAGVDLEHIESLEQLRSLPFTSKSEFVEDQALHPPFGSNFTFPAERYIRMHQTSGTTGKPMYWLDTEESWDWWAECWKVIFEAAGVRARDRVYFAFSFGPFIGFWAGWEGARKLGSLAICGGAQSTGQRLRAIIDCGATVLVSTPTYALHMASEAKKAGIDLAKDSAIKITIHAGEPGASIPSTKKLIEESWGARCFDHAGATEAGAFGFECRSQPGAMHVNENEFIVEVIDPMTEEATAPEAKGELVITNLGRLGSPVIRYRTGDLVQANRQPCPCGRAFILLEGGVLGRIDDMIVIRGINVFPSALAKMSYENFPKSKNFASNFRATSPAHAQTHCQAGFGSTPSVGLSEKISNRVRERIGLRPRS